MNWVDLKNDLAPFAPAAAELIGGAIGGIPGAKVGSMIAAALGVDDTPDAVSQALKVDPEAAVKLKALDTQLQIAQLTAASSQVQSVNQTMQVEDKTRAFTWRDLWGYVSGIAFGFVVGLVIYIVVSGIYLNQPGLMNQIPAIVGAFSVLFGIAATVLGVQSSIEAHHSGMVDRLNAGDGK